MDDRFLCMLDKIPVDSLILNVATALRFAKVRTPDAPMLRSQFLLSMYTYVQIHNREVLFCYMGPQMSSPKALLFGSTLLITGLFIKMHLISTKSCSMVAILLEFDFMRLPSII